MTMPDKWVVIKLSSADAPPIYKVLGSWYGGYLHGNSWRMNSGINKVEKIEDAFLFYGFSGSCYECGFNNYGMHMDAGGVLESLKKSPHHTVEVMPEDFNWLDLWLDLTSTGDSAGIVA